MLGEIPEHFDANRRRGSSTVRVSCLLARGN